MSGFAPEGYTTLFDAVAQSQIKLERALQLIHSCKLRGFFVPSRGGDPIEADIFHWSKGFWSEPFARCMSAVEDTEQPP